MKFDIKSLIKDKNVLRIVVFLSVMNVLGYLLARDLDSVAFFGIVGFLATYFSKNMIVVLLIAMIATNFLTVLRRSKDVVEGMKSSRKTTEEEEGPAPDNEEEEQAMADGKPGKLDKAATVDAAYDSVDNAMGADEIKKMQAHTEQFKKQQESLHKSLNAAAPALDRAQEVMQQMGGVKGMENMLNKVESMIDKISGFTGSIGGAGK